MHSLATCSRASDTMAELAWEIPRERRFSVVGRERPEQQNEGGMNGENGRKASPPRCGTLRIVLLLGRARPVDLGDVGGRVSCLRLFVVAALVENLRQVGSVDLPQLLVVIEGGTEVPVFTFRTQEERPGEAAGRTRESSHSSWSFSELNLVL